MGAQFKLKNVKEQEAYLLVLEGTIEDRKEVVATYLQLPIHLRNDKEFLEAGAAKREEMLEKAFEQKNREKENPLAIADTSKKTSSQIATEFLSRLQTENGKESIGDVIEDVDEQGKLDIVKNQLDIRSKMFGVSQQMEQEDLTMKGAYLSDLAKWMRTSKDLWMDEGNVHSERDQWKFETLQTAGEMYDYGIRFTSGGVISVDASADGGGEQTMEEFRKGKNNVSRAKYSQHALLIGDDGKDVLDPMEATTPDLMNQLMRIIEIIAKRAGNEQGLSQSVIQVLMNSEDVQRELARQLVSGEHANIRDREYSSNSEKFVQEIVQS